MQTKSASQSGFFNFRVLLALTLCSLGALLAVSSFVPQVGPLVGGREDTEKLERYMPVPGGDPDDLDRMEAARARVKTSISILRRRRSGSNAGAAARTAITHWFSHSRTR